MKLLDVLPTGRENAVPAKELVKLLGLRSVRDITQMIERARRSGAPICATPSKGYYLAESPEELAQYITALGERIQQVTLTKLHCAETLERWRETEGR